MAAPDLPTGPRRGAGPHERPAVLPVHVEAGHIGTYHKARAKHLVVLSQLLALGRQLWRDRRAVRVLLGTTMMVDGRGPTFASAKATNVGHRVVVIDSIGLHLPGSGVMPGQQLGKHFGLEDTPLPARLNDGDSATAHWPCAAVGRLLAERYPDDGPVKLTPVCRDSAGGEYRGKPWKVTPNELTAMG